jgi:hypothetical protein
VTKRKKQTTKEERKKGRLEEMGGSMSPLLSLLLRGKLKVVWCVSCILRIIYSREDLGKKEGKRGL